MKPIAPSSRSVLATFWVSQGCERPEGNNSVGKDSTRIGSVQAYTRAQAIVQAAHWLRKRAA